MSKPMLTYAEQGSMTDEWCSGHVLMAGGSHVLPYCFLVRSGILLTNVAKVGPLYRPCHTQHALSEAISSLD